MSSPRFSPMLIPDTIKCGRCGIILLVPSKTQSVGVPLTAKKRGPNFFILLQRKGRFIVKEWLQALCSRSGATTQTSATGSKALANDSKPGDWIPSSLETKIFNISLPKGRRFTQRGRAATKIQSPQITQRSQKKIKRQYSAPYTLYPIPYTL